MCVVVDTVNILKKENRRLCHLIERLSYKRYIKIARLSQCVTFTHRKPFYNAKSMVSLE